MKRLGIEWDRRRIDGKNYVHVGFYVDAPDKRRTAARVAAVIAATAFAAFMLFAFPDVDTHTPDLEHGITEARR